MLRKSRGLGATLFINRLLHSQMASFPTMWLSLVLLSSNCTLRVNRFGGLPDGNTKDQWRMAWI
jgi:hypothetical protein